MAYRFPIMGGDADQRTVQAALLKAHRFDVGRLAGYPAVRTKQEFLGALRLLWERRPAGWWNLAREMVLHKICRQEEVDALLTSKSGRGAAR